MTNDDEVSTQFRPFTQMIERVNRIYEASYRPTCSFDSYDGGLTVTLPSELLIITSCGLTGMLIFDVLNKVEIIENAGNMPAKWQMLTLLGQQIVLNLQK